MNLKSLLSFLIANKLFILITVFSAVLCGLNIYGAPLYILDEVRNAEAAREMLATKNFIVPTFNNALRTDKPPLHYFFMMLGYKTFGVNPLGARFFSSVFGVLTLVTTFYFLNKIKGSQLAFITLCILFSSVFFIQEFHLSVPDPYLIFFINLALFCFYSFYRSSKMGVLLLGYVCVGFGFLAKGPVALGIVALSVILYLILRRDISFRRIWSFKPLLGLVIILAIAAPWFYMVHTATGGEWTRSFFLNHNIGRFGNKMEGHGGPFVITWLFVVLGLLPFSVFIIQAFYFAFKQRNCDSYILFALCVCLVVIGVFTVSGTKLPNYTMPCYPMLASLIGAYLIDFFKKRSPRRRMFIQISFIVLLIISFLLPVGAFVALSGEPSLQHLSKLSFLLVILPVGITFSYLFFKEDNYKNSFVLISGTWIVLVVFLFWIIYPKLLKENPVYASYRTLKKEIPVVVYKRMDSAFPINYQRTYQVVTTPQELTGFLKQHPNVYVITNDRNAKDEIATIPTLQLIMEKKALFENHITLIYEQK